MSKARGLADLGNVYDDGALSNRNLIINSNFQVSQRGDFTSASVVSNQSYYLDRWVMSVGISGTLQDTGYKAKVVCTSTGSGVLAMSQNIEDKNIHPFKGKTVTVSCKMTSNSPNARIVIYADNWLSLGNQNDVHSGSGNEETLSATFTVPSDLSGYLQVRVGFENAESNGNPSLSANDYFEVSDIQLEVGDTATPFEHPRSYSDELSRCQRYFYSAADGTAQALGMGVYYTTTQMFGAITFPVTMRATPTLAAASGSQYYEFIRDGGADYFNSLSLGNRTTNKIGEIQNDSEVGGTGRIGYGGWIRTDNSSVYVHFDAEL